MKSTLKLLFVFLVGALVLTGCRTANVYNVEKQPINAKISMDSIYSAIKRAGYSKGWVVTKVKSGLAQAKLVLRTHVAIVEIPYTANSFSIQYKDSQNLKFNPENGTIHSNYNGWVTNLENAINFEIASLKE